MCAPFAQRHRQQKSALRHRTFGPLLILLSTLGCAACEGNDRSPSVTLTIDAASSLTDVVRELATAFEAEHPHCDIQLNFAGSQTLRFQIEHGAQADVFISASEDHIERITTSHGFANVGPIATNQLALIVPENNPAEISRFEELRRARRIVLGGANVPIGHYTQRCLNNASQRYGANFLSHVRQYTVSEEHNVRAVRAKVLLGEADAAFVYETRTPQESTRKNLKSRRRARPTSLF